jgi:acyl transferase domain-containing protein/acyl carrier protein/ubiquinone/menaquinone biosynthesis C-methylase UbiE
MAPDLDQFWRNLVAGRDCIVEIPPDRWALDGFYDPNRERPETSYSKWGGFIDDVDKFDARFFNISPREADALDPQTRKFLEVAWATMEDAGLTRDTLFHGEPDPTQRLAGVFVGVMYGDYQLFGPEEAALGNLIAPNAAYWNVANRVSHFLDLHGPSMAIDTACSSSLSAIHMACAALRSGDCTVAFAGGVNVTVHPSKHWILSKSGFASSDGRCRSFGEGGDGYVPGEGVGAVLLKPLARAVADGDRIHAVIRSSALNHGGRTNGYTVPNPVAQGNLIAAAMKRGGVTPDSISYVEAHGTGTSLGDPVEIAGLARAFAGATVGSCAIGSVKSNIGHLESAAGIAALTKVVLQLRHDSLVPSLHAKSTNPNLQLSITPFLIQTATASWIRPSGGARRAGISSFGAGGANAHLVIEDAPPSPDETRGSSEPLIVPLSAATRDALTEQASRLADWLEQNHAEVEFASVVRTLQVGREPMRHRHAMRAATCAELIGALREFVDGKAASTTVVADWVSGGRIDWDTLAPGARRPVSLPTYPFAKRRCWVTLTPRGPVEIAGPRAISGASDDPLVSDHRLGGEIVLAGAFLLESARSVGERVLNTAITGVSDIRFLRPVSASMSPMVSVGPDGAFAIRVGENEHAIGRLLTDVPPRSPDPLGLDAIEARCGTRIEHDAVYTALVAGGAQYGPAYRVIETVWRGPGEALAELAPDLSGGGWTPNILDAAFQLTFALTEDGGGLAPFTVDRITVFGLLTSATHIVGARRETGPGFVRLDLWLTDADGEILLAVDGFVARTLPATLPLRLLRPTWSQTVTQATTPLGRAAMVGPGADGDLGRALSAAWPNGGATFVSPLPDAIDAEQVWYFGELGAEGSEIAAVTTFAHLVKILAAQPRAVSLTVVVRCANAVLDGEVPNAAAAAVAAFAKSVAREHPEFRLRVIDAGPDVAADDLLGVPNIEREIALRNGRAWTKSLTEATLPATPAMPWRRNGTYLIAGGAGGIGLALAEHLIEQAAARIAILGRRPMDTALRGRLDRLGGEVLYLQADVTDPDAVKSAVGIVNARFGDIDAAFHLALAMHDARAVTLTPEQIAAVMAPKTLGVRNLIAALHGSKLDSLMLFSSSNAHTTNPGQSAYAAASAAEDAIGLQPAPWPVKVIDWGFWGDVGRVATPEYRASLARIGVHPIGTQEGLDIVARMSHASLPQIVPLRITDSVAQALGVRRFGAIDGIADAVAERAALAAPMLVAASGSFAAMDSYAAGLLLLALQDMGALRREGETIGPDFAARFGLHPRFSRLQAALLDILVRAGYLTGLGDNRSATRMAVRPAEERKAALQKQRTDWVVAQPEVAPYLDLLDICHSRLGEVLRGEVDANEVLFPNGKAHLVEPIYRGNKVIDHFQSIVADAAVAAVRQGLQTLPPEGKLRVLEIGAGTGGTSAFAIAALAPFASRIAYLFTDIGPTFLDAARQRFGQHPFVSFEHLDIERSPTGQGFDANSFDVVIAANVLHATRDLDTTLEHVRALCRKGGVLLVNEATARQDFNTMTFGLTRGWWLFADTERRIPHAPLLDADAWLNALALHGFKDMRILSGGAGGLQSVIAAEGDGGAASVPQPEPKPAARHSAGDRKLEDLLRETVARSLRLSPEEVEPETSFAEYGADSIISVDLVREINLALGIELKTTALFNYSTVRTLAGYIATEYGDRFAATEAEKPKPTSRVRERSERLREIIRKRRDSVTFAAEPDTPPADVAPSWAEPAARDEEATLLALLQRLQAGKINVNQALAETGDD